MSGAVGSRARAVRAAVVAGAVAVVAFVLAGLAGGGLAEKVVPGLGDADGVTRWGLPLARLVMDLGATLTVGALLMGAFLLPGEKGAIGERAVPFVRATSWLAATWALAAAVTMIFTLSNVTGDSAATIVSGDRLSGLVGQVPQATALMVVVLLAVVIALLTRTTVSQSGAFGLLAMAILGLLPAPLNGHAASSPNHELAVTGVALHVAAVVPWVGGLAMVGWLAFTGAKSALGPKGVLAVAATRFSRMALVCYVAVGVSGAASAIVRLPALSDLWASDYGRLVIVKIAAFLVLGWLGTLHRGRTLPAIEAGRPRAFARLAAVEVAVMAGTMGVAVSLQGAAPPSLGTETYAKGVLGYDMPGPLTAGRLLTLWRPDLFFATLVIVLGGVYLAAVLRLRRRGDSWPVGRTVAWMFGLFTIVAVTMSGVATYAPILFSVHMAQHMVLAMLSPIFLVLGAPVTLALRALRPAAVKGDRGPREWLVLILHSRFVKVISHPAVATAIFIGSTYALYFTPLFESAMRAHVGHIAMQLHFLLAGGLFYWVLIGVDPAPHRLPFVGRILVLFVTMPFHAFFGISLMNMNELAPHWYNPLGRDWGPTLATDVHTGGSIAWAFGEIPTFIVLLALVFQWFVEDQRLARRTDRNQDRAEAEGQEGELADYNAYLAGLQKRELNS